MGLFYFYYSKETVLSFILAAFFFIILGSLRMDWQKRSDELEAIASELDSYKDIDLDEGTNVATNSDRDETVVDARLQSPFTALIAGPTGSGKTRMLYDLIENRDTVSNSPPVEIIYCYGAYQKEFENISGVRFVEGMIDIRKDIKNDGRNRWLIIDDLMEELSGKQDTNGLYTKYSHHQNISVFFVVQNLFLKSLRTISINCHYMWIFKNPRATASVQQLGSQLFPHSKGFLLEAYRDATKKPFSSLFLDMKQNTDERMRVRAGFSSNTPMITYVPKYQL